MQQKDKVMKSQNWTNKVGPHFKCEDEETNDDNIPLNKIYMHCHTTKTKHWRNKKNKIL